MIIQFWLFLSLGLFKYENLKFIKFYFFFISLNFIIIFIILSIIIINYLLCDKNLYYFGLKSIYIFYKNNQDLFTSNQYISHGNRFE